MMIVIYVIAGLRISALVLIWLIKRQINIHTVDNFLPRQECQHLIKLSTRYLEEDRQVVPPIITRTSTPVFFRSGDDEIIGRIRERAATYLKIPEKHLEKLQVIRYGLTQGYSGHLD
jgi:hypothetical protein